MVLNDDRGEQTQLEWRSRLARERLDLSASVEETLEESASQSWQEDEWDSAMYTAQHTTHGAALIPPRLSLQSKAMPAVHAGGFIETASSMYPALPANAEGERKPAVTQNPNRLMRLAQRLTSSLAAFGSVLHPEASVVSSAPLSDEAEAPIPVSHSAEESLKAPESTELPIIHPKRSASEESAAWQTLPGWPDLTAEHTAIQGERSGLVGDTDAELNAAVRNITSSRVATPTVQSKQRLAGHTAKIRLQTANGKTNAKSSERFSGASDGAVGEARKIEEQAIDTVRQEIENTSMHLPAMDVWRKETNMTSARLDVVREEIGETSVHMPTVSAASRAKSAVLQRPLSGTGVFEYGQMDVIVTSPAITAASVVMVMLASNPGPVVVQYVSLQPRVGFTVHLTAPTTARTPFNYVIFEGETPYT